MRVVLSPRLAELVGEGDGHREADVELRLDGTPTLAELLGALGLDGEVGLTVDGLRRRLDEDVLEAGLHEGARLGLAEESGAPVAAADGIELHVIAGFDAGRRETVGRDGLTIGRDAECDLQLADPGISRRHLHVRPITPDGTAMIEDVGSANGTWLEGERLGSPATVAPGAVFEAGDCAFTCAPARARGRAHAGTAGGGAHGTQPFNRPPRVRPGSPPALLSVPDAPAATEGPRLSIAAAVGPVILGVVMVVALHSLLFALFMLMSPVLVIGSWYENRRHARRASGGQTREYRQALARFETELAEQHERARQRLREAFPDLAELTARALGATPELWQRRPADEDFLRLSAGLGEVPSRPPLVQHRAPSREAAAILAARSRIELAPIAVELAGGGVAGICGPRAGALALARALLLQAVILHGPADLTVAVLCEREVRHDWDWTKWLPHVRDAASGGGRRYLSSTPESAAAIVELLAPERRGNVALLAVIDGESLLSGRGATGRTLLRDASTNGIVVAATRDRLPSSVTTVIEVGDEAGEAIVSVPGRGERTEPVLVTGATAATARECAVALSALEDAELSIPGGSLPQRAALLPLLGLELPDAASLRARWERADPARLPLRFAVDEDGPLELELVRDGPHGLIAGTTGAGKSELLRSLLAGLAAEHPPEELNFFLIDYKGGSAFAQCAELPHAVGLVTDLDEHLGARALVSLEAELRHRERLLRDLGVGDLAALLALRQREPEIAPLPRLLVVIDEFATLAAELPDFITSLVGVAQRGRSLGVHMILATQRPAGAVNENIRANTNLRICLRVQTPQDSVDVIEAPDAARIPRETPGRGFVRLGHGELVAIQTALVTGPLRQSAEAAVEILPFAFPSGPSPSVSSADDAPAAGETELEALVAAARAAASGMPELRRPWLPPLPAEIPLEVLTRFGAPVPLGGTTGQVIALGVADEPAIQAQYPCGWNLDAGNLLLYGIGGSGTTTALLTLARSAAAALGPEQLHLYAIDLGAGELAMLEGLPHTGAVLRAGQGDRHRRLLRRLHAELRRRRRLEPAERAALPRIVLLLDGYSGFAAEHADLVGEAVRADLLRIWAEGTELGVHVAIAADRAGAVPMNLASLAAQRLAFRLADSTDYAAFGIPRRDVPELVPGRALVAGSGMVVQVARSRQPLPAAAGPRPAGAAPPVEVLPDRVTLAETLRDVTPSADPLLLPLGIGDLELAPVGFVLNPAEHALITGPSRSGRSTALITLARAAQTLYPELTITAVALRRSPVRELDDVALRVTAEADLEGVARLAAEASGPVLVLVDDADLVEDRERRLAGLIAARHEGVHVVAAGRPDGLRALVHWTAPMRASRVGLLLAPDIQLDGALLSTALPRRPEPPRRPGCGYLVLPSGPELVQVADVTPLPPRTASGQAAA